MVLWMLQLKIVTALIPLVVTASAERPRRGLRVSRLREHKRRRRRGVGRQVSWTGIDLETFGTRQWG